MYKRPSLIRQPSFQKNINAVAPRVSRRRVIEVLTLSPIQGLPRLNVDANAADDEATYYYLGESGWSGPHVALFIGMVLTRNPVDHKKAISAIRQEIKYRSVLRYRSTDHFKVAYGKEVIRYFLTQNEMRFFGFKVKIVDDWPDSADDRHALYFSMYKR